jgi:hypothetical protein
MRRSRMFAALLAAGALCAAASAAAASADDDDGDGREFVTSRPSMLATVKPGASVQPIITVGETLRGGYRFEAIPDGISLRERDDRVDVFVNHETSTVPFPFTFPGAPTEANQNDFENAQLSRLTLSERGRVLRGQYAIDSAAGYQRFCSNYMATEREGFDRPILFTNEEAIDWVKRKGTSWPATIGDPAARQAGVVVAYDPRNGQHRPIWGMGRHNHENSVALPGFEKPVVLSGDDTFVSNPAQSQLYSYIAEDRRAVWNDAGDLYAFVSDDPAVNDYYDFPVGSSMSVSGRLVKVPKDVATGRKPDGTDLLAADKGYPPPPSDGTWQRDPFVPQPGPGVDGPQWVLEHWSDLNNVFQFVRLEDIAYDKRRGMSNVVYLADSGRGATSAGGNPFTSTNGRVWKVVLDRKDPTRVDSLSILIEGDDAPVKTLAEIHQPDNLESTRSSLLIQEDPGSAQQFPAGSTDPNATTARIWRYDLAGGQTEVIAKVDQSADEGDTDVDGTPGVFAPGNLGAWESSGIVDASDVFGHGSFLVTVQAHTLWVEKAPGDDVFPPEGADFTYKREGGQLVVLRVPDP